MAHRVTLAFYRGWGGNWLARLSDAVTRFVTLSRFSHVEVIDGAAVLGEVNTCWSSSFRDGGVRYKDIMLKPEKWVLVPVVVPDTPGPDPIEILAVRLSMKYTVAGAILSALRPPVDLFWNKCFCSEVAALAVGIPRPWAYSPGRLYRRLK